MWSLIIAFMLETVPAEARYIQLAEMATYQECKDLSNILRKHGLNGDTFLFCVEKQ